ncbi:MAG: DEAD/DEAH box helicase, partial [Oligosphaeraceae bacterium]|nr:DEAD/DEAH box helicase [Oligosphaeraceae bacterium]
MTDNAPADDAISTPDELAATAVPSEDTPESPANSFASFGLGADLLRGITEAGFSEPTLIQQKSIPYLLAGRDLIGQALTGSGKTAAYALPAMELIRGKQGLQFLVLVPTRELAAQVSSEIFKLGQFAGIRTAAFTGGQSYNRQEQLLRQGLNALVATPGRLIDLMKSGHFKAVNPAVMVVDEADEMLDMGFLEDVKVIFEQFPGPHQTMLFSATLPKQVVALAQKILQNPVDITTAISEATNNDIEQHNFVIEEHERVNACIRLIDSEEVSKAMIFCRTREETDALNILLGGRGYNVNCLHGDMEQAQRSRVMSAFRRNDFDILVATDVAARGLDVEDVSHVFNFHLPFDSRGYVHRIGRTGRAGKSGKAITLVTPRELRQLEAIKRTVGAEMQLGLIPTRKEVYNQRLQKLFGELFVSDLNPSLYNQVLEISQGQDQDPLVLFTKLLTRFLSGNNDQGPEQIGLTGDRLDRALNKRPRFERDGRPGRGAPRSRSSFERRGPSRTDRPDREEPPRRNDFKRDAEFRRPPQTDAETAAGQDPGTRKSPSTRSKNLEGLSRAIRIAEEIDRQRQSTRPPRPERPRREGEYRSAERPERPRREGEYRSAERPERPRREGEYR